MNQKIKILHIIKTLNLGGAEKNLLNFITHSDKKKYEHIVAYSSGGELEKLFKTNNIKMLKFAEKNIKIKDIRSVPIILKLSKYIKKENIKIVHTHNFNAHIWGAIAAKLAKAKIVEHVHDFRYMDESEYKKRFGNVRQFRYIKYFPKISDKVILLTEANKKYILKHHFYSENKLEKIYNGIPIKENIFTDEQKTKIKHSLNLKKENKIILTCSRISPEKNIKLIVRIAEKLIKELPDTVFLIAGDGPELNTYKQKVKKLKNVKFIGFFENTSLLYSIADVFFLPSFLELHSIAILEAMSHKVPVVVSKDTGNNSEFIVHNENGFLHDPFSENGWKESLKELITNKEKAINFAEKSFEICKKLFNIKTTSKKIENIYEELLQ